MEQNSVQDFKITMINSRHMTNGRQEGKKERSLN